MSAPPGIERVVVFDIEHTCGAVGCAAAPEVLLVAQLKGGGVATRWVCRQHEEGAVPRDLAEIVVMRVPNPSEVH